MENDNNEVTDYSFLCEENVERHFADVNIQLLSGVHIDQKQYALFSLLELYENQLRQYYENLYKLNLVGDIFGGHKCYYLELPEVGKGKLGDPRTTELNPAQTVIGLMLLDMYYQRYFDAEKIVFWDDIKTQILESDHQEAYKRMLFKSVRDSYDEKDWSNAEGKFSRAIDSFAKLGWVEKLSGRDEVLSFEIRPAIHRLSKLYNAELSDLSSFATQLQNSDRL